MNWTRLSLYVVAVVFLGPGATSLIAPANLTPLVEIAMPTRIAVMEVRSVKAGFSAALVSSFSCLPAMS